MLPAFLGLAVVFVAAFVLVAPRVSRRLRRQVPGATVVPPARPRTVRGMAVPVQPTMTGPFAYDDGVLTGRPDEEES